MVQISGLGLECDSVLKLGQESEMEQNRQGFLSNSEWLQLMVVVNESEGWGKCQWDTPQGFEL